MTVSPQTAEPGLQRLVKYLAHRTGLDFSGCHRDRLIATVMEMYENSGASGHVAYAELLDRDRTEYELLVDRLTVGESYFFREPAYLQLLRETIVPEWHRRGGGRLRVWSAGCASGEEAYSVAIALGEVGLRGRSQIIGTDLSERALDRARAAVFSPWSLRRCDDAQRRTWFRPEGRGFQLHDRYRDDVQWRASGLLDGPPAGGFDLVLCRNVLIYLTPEAVAVAAETLHDALAPNGWLVLGVADPVLDHDGLQRVHGQDGPMYRRSERPKKRTSPSVQRAAPNRSLVRSTRRPRASCPTLLVPADKRLVSEDNQLQNAGPVGIRELGSQGKIEEAGNAADAAIAAEPTDAEVRYLAATVHLHAGRPVDAARAAAAAVYLDPGLVVGHLLLAQAEKVAGHQERAERSYRNALELLAAMAPDAEVALADGERAADLAAVVHAQLHADPGRVPR